MALNGYCPFEEGICINKLDNSCMFCNDFVEIEEMDGLRYLEGD